MAEVTLVQVILGLTPFTLIELREASDGSGEPALHVQFGGGAESPIELALLVVTESPAEGNPVAEMLRRLYREMDGSRVGPQTTIMNVVREFNPDWAEFVEAD